MTLLHGLPKNNNTKKGKQKQIKSPADKYKFEELIL